LKILVVTRSGIPHAGGASTHIEDLISGLRCRGHSATLIHGGQCRLSYLRCAFQAALFLGSREKLTSWHMHKSLERMQKAIQVELRNNRPDVIHCHDVFAGASALTATANDATPVVATVHGPALYEAQMGGVDKMPIYRDMILSYENKTYAGARNLIAVDTGQASILRQDYGVAPSRITVIFNAVDVDELRELSKQEPFFDPGGPYFLVPRRLVPKTGVRYSIEAMSRITDGNVHLVIAGDGPLRKELENLTKELGLSGRVHFLGAVPRKKLIPLFRPAMGVIVPSVPSSGVVEATSLAVTEAMACETIPIASDIGGLAELIQNEHTGLLVPPREPEALANALARMLEDHALRNRLIASASKKVQTDYSREVWLDRVQGVYHDSMSTTPSAN